MTSTARKPYDVLAQIQRILYAHPRHVVQKWDQVFHKFRNFELSRLKGEYWNSSPEAIEYELWQILYWGINTMIDYPTPKYDWEKTIIEVYMGTYKEPDPVPKQKPVCADSVADSVDALAPGIFIDQIELDPHEEGQWKVFDDSYDDPEEREADRRQAAIDRGHSEMMDRYGRW